MKNGILYDYFFSEEAKNEYGSIISIINGVEIEYTAKFLHNENIKNHDYNWSDKVYLGTMEDGKFLRTIEPTEY